MTGNEQSVSHEAWLDAVASNDGFYLVCPNGHTWLPPQHTCSRCGSTELDSKPLPRTGTVRTYTEITALPSRYAHRDAVAVALTDFDAVRITGQLVDFEYATVDQGTLVELAVESVSGTDERIVAFSPVEAQAEENS